MTSECLPPFPTPSRFLPTPCIAGIRGGRCRRRYGRRRCSSILPDACCLVRRIDRCHDRGVGSLMSISRTVTCGLSVLDRQQLCFIPASCAFPSALNLDLVNLSPPVIHQIVVPLHQFLELFHVLGRSLRI